MLNDELKGQRKTSNGWRDKTDKDNSPIEQLRKVREALEDTFSGGLHFRPLTNSPIMCSPISCWCLLGAGG